ncbi:DUF397 domain-containing protein [Actinomadura spongiicola]|uniref:DUF397 domain-containing protein n=1 Tax=Actinomadura spongiicola TaxID=2303421 RepID=UPI001F3ECCB7|nr:DUF397 domain-containing protein [Actinomadura spongiicola]
MNWRKASHSEDSDCVEVAALGSSALVRDSKDPAAGVLTLDSVQWNALLNAVRSGDLNGR